MRVTGKALAKRHMTYQKRRLVGRWHPPSYPRPLPSTDNQIRHSSKLSIKPWLLRQAAFLTAG